VAPALGVTMGYGRGTLGREVPVAQADCDEPAGHDSGYNIAVLGLSGSDCDVGSGNPD
jgi:hypothetical protein